MAGTLISVPLQAVPSQSAQVILGGQNCLIRIYQKGVGLMIDLFVDGNPLVLGRICRDRNLLVRYRRFGFVGDLFFIDQQGESDPNYSGLRDRFSLIYMEEGSS